MEEINIYLDIEAMLIDANTVKKSDTPDVEFLENLPDGTSLERFHFKGSAYIGCIKYLDLEAIRENELDICVVTGFGDDVVSKRNFATEILQGIASVYQKQGIRINFRQYNPESYVEYINKREPKLLKQN